MLQEDSTLNHAEIRWAIEATIEPRKMTMPAAVPVGFSDPFALVTIKQTQQNAFLKITGCKPLCWPTSWKRYIASFNLLLRPCEVSSRISNPPILKVAHNALGVLLQHRHVIVGGFT